MPVLGKVQQKREGQGTCFTRRKGITGPRPKHRRSWWKRGTLSVWSLLSPVALQRRGNGNRRVASTQVTSTPPLPGRHLLGSVELAGSSGRSMDHSCTSVAAAEILPSAPLRCREGWERGSLPRQLLQGQAE